MANDTQRRAQKGGEFGANGEWYEGGKFIATSENTIKSAPAERRAYTPDPAQEARAAAINAWLAQRQAELAPIVAQLTSKPDGIDEAVWQQRVIDHAAGFLPSLGRTLHVQGSLSAKQAEFVAKAILGRCTRRNAAEFDALLEKLTTEFA